MFAISASKVEDVTFSIVAGVTGDTYGYSSTIGSISPDPSYISKAFPIQIIKVEYDVSQTRLSIACGAIWSVNHQDVMRFDMLVAGVYVATLTATAIGQSVAANNSVGSNPFSGVGSTYRVDLINFRPHAVL
jgi:hypothetical protein